MQRNSKHLYNEHLNNVELSTELSIIPHAPESNFEYTQQPIKRKLGAIFP